MGHSSIDTETPAPRMARIHVDQYHRMLEAGVFRDGDPIELLDGLLVYKDRSDHGGDPMTIGKRHNLVIKLLTGLDPELRRRNYHMQTQGPIALPPHHEPEPDGAILQGSPRDYADRLPEARDVVCVIEVADSSLAQDRTTKLAVYAAAGIPCYLIINLSDRQIERFEEPVPEAARYQRTVVLSPDGMLSLALVGEPLNVPVRELLP